MGESSEVVHNKPDGKGALAALLVDDSPLDAELLARHLRHNGYEIQHRRVDGAAEFREALRQQKWDIILCDYQMPAFGVEAALGILAELRMDIPFIVVSGAAGEDLAVEVMKQGAHDYVLKYRMARLVPAIERERREVATRRERAAALRKVTYLAAIVDSSSEAIVGHDIEGKVTTWNWGAEQLFGYKGEEAMGRSISALFAPGGRAEVSKILASLMRGEECPSIETMGLRKDAHVVDVALTISPIKDAEGKLIGASSFAYDITERKQLEAERQKMIQQLNETLSRVKTLSGLLPICASCKKVRDDRGYWQKLEIFVHEHSEAEFSHSICPECMETLYPQFVKPKETAKPPGSVSSA